jgi:hypothetical protein
MPTQTRQRIIPAPLIVILRVGPLRKLLDETLLKKSLDRRIQATGAQT